MLDHCCLSGDRKFWTSDMTTSPYSSAVSQPLVCLD
uniref:Uncharacterized protein n=1 Tax=Anguilla anguilla TaxID=7936 RepID=A0A0E9UMP8_ANGAN